MSPHIHCDDVMLVSWLMSNPPPHHARTGTMVLVCCDRSFDWPKVADGYDEGKQRGMEAA